MKKGIISFIDILGFREMVKNHPNDTDFFSQYF